MEIYLGNEDSISQSEFQFLLEQEEKEKENQKKSENDDSNVVTEKEETKIEEKVKEDTSSGSVDAPVSPAKIMRANYIDIAAILLLILTVGYLYWYASCNPLM